MEDTMKKNIFFTIALLSLAGVSSINAGKTGAFFGGLGTGIVLTKVAESANNSNRRGGDCFCPDVSGYKQQIKKLNSELKSSQTENKKLIRSNGKLEGKVESLQRKLDRATG